MQSVFKKVLCKPINIALTATNCRLFCINTLPETYKNLWETCRKFSEEELKPLAGTFDKTQNFPKEQINKLGKMGLMGITASSKYGGSGMDILSTAIAVEELSRGCSSTGAIVSIHNILYINFLETYGNRFQKEKYLQPFTTGIPGAFALSESEAGSDVSNISTTATKENNVFILNGAKSWVTSAIESDIAIVFATVDKEKKHRGLTAFIVPLNTCGIVIGKKEKKMGIRASSTCPIYFDNVRIPEENLVGAVGEGFTMAMEQLNKARIGIAAQAVGIAQAALDTALQYATTRKAFGNPLCELQAVQLRLARMSTKIEAARLLVWKAAKMCDLKQNFIKNSSIAKLYAGETATYSAHECVQILGGMGYVEDMPAERYYRDSRITEIYGGVSDIQMIIIADQLLKNIGYRK